MSWQVRYRLLFSLRIMHDAQLDFGKDEFGSVSQFVRDQRIKKYQISDSISLIPTAECQRLIERHQLRCRPTPFGLDIYASAVPDSNSPEEDLLVRPLESDAVFRFVLEVQNGNFLSAANVSLETALRESFYFSNSHQHREGNELHLTKPVPAFDPIKSYRAGDLVVDDEIAPTILLEATEDLAPAASPALAKWLKLPAPLHEAIAYKISDRIFHAGKVFEAISAGNHPLPPSPAWRELYTPQILTGVTSADRVIVLPRALQLPLAESLTFARVELFQADGALLQTFLLYHETGENLTSLDLDLSDLPVGFYRLEAKDSAGVMLAGFPLEFYLAEPSVVASPFGVIEIFHQNNSSGFLDATGHLLSPNYYIRFRKRHSHWRYVFHGDISLFPPAQLGDLVQEDPADASRFITTAPLPLTSGSVLLRKFAGSISLPNPELSSATRDGNKIVSETFIHV